MPLSSTSSPDAVGDRPNVLAGRLLRAQLGLAVTRRFGPGGLVYRVAAAVDGFRMQRAADLRGDVGAAVVDDEHAVRVIDALLENRDEIRQFGHADDGPRRGPRQMLVDHHTAGAGDHRAAAAADRRAQVHDRGFDLVDDRLAGALALELLARRPPLEIELSLGVVGVVRVLEVDRSERPRCVQQLAEALRIHA
jgi:hypothetical protein